MGRGPRMRRALGLDRVGVLLLGAFGAWIGSRTYFVDGAPGQTSASRTAPRSTWGR